MLRLTLELVPWGMESRKRTLGTMTIANDGTGTQTKGNYRCSLFTGEKLIKKTEIKDYLRKKYTVWKLIKIALNQMVK